MEAYLIRFITLDYVNKRVKLLTSKGRLFSMDYDGRNQRLMFSDPLIYSGLFSEFGKSMYFRKKRSPLHIVEMNVMSRNISRYIPLPGDEYPQTLIVVSRSLQPEGMFYASNIDMRQLNRMSSLTINS